MAPLAAAVQQEELQKFFASNDGLSMRDSDATTLASKERTTLTTCGITVPYLKQLRDILYGSSGFDLSLSDVQKNILWIAYQHVNTKDLLALYKALYTPSGADLPLSDARKQALLMAANHAEPYLVAPLYKALYSPSMIDLTLPEARKWVVNLTYAGADPSVLASVYAKGKDYGKDKALRWAILGAVEQNLDGLDQRYAKNAQPYTAKGFYDYYGDSWLGEWTAAPKQKRTAADGIAYFASDFKAFFGDSWASKWDAAPVATQHRIADDGKVYTIAGFQQYYSDEWQTKWSAASEVLDLCAGLNQASCKASPDRCQWKFNGDWTTSCVPQPLADAVAAALLV